MMPVKPEAQKTHGMCSTLTQLICRQLSFFGRLSLHEKRIIENHIGTAVQLVQKTLNLTVNIPKSFNVRHSLHSTAFMYILAKIIHESSPDEHHDICEKLFLLNRMLNSIDLYYKIQMPEHFLIGHGLGAVFSKACYGNYLVVFQNVTIGVQDGLYPSIGDKTVIYPNCIIAGKTIIGENSVIGAGTKLINKTIPDCSLVFEKDGNLCVKQNTQSEIEKYFRIN